ncbi:MAG: M48 family metallopeptidase [Fibrobacterales bacterium]
MTSQTLLILFISLFSLNTLITIFLEKINSNNLKKFPSAPGQFSSSISETEYLKSQEYTKDKSQFSILSTLYSAIITLIILFSGILPWVDHTVLDVFSVQAHPLSHSVLVILLLSFIASIPNIPFKLYSTFKLEAKFGFNKQTFKEFVIDEAKGLLLSLIIGVPLLFAVFWFFDATGPLWWLWLFGFIALFQIVMMVIYPIWIAPLFNSFTPLEEGELKERLADLAQKASFATQGIFVMDGSKRSGHSNAYFTGFGSFRRVVLYDTLIEQLTTDELVSVLAHEIGHYKKKHIYKMLTRALLFMGFGLYILSYAIGWEPLYTSFDVTPSYHMGLFLFMTILSPLLFFITPITNLFSRKYEYEADAYAVTITEKKSPMQQALINLSKKNLSNLTPHPLYSGFYYSHPTTLERIDAIEEL